jgi:hypothetical protein
VIVTQLKLHTNLLVEHDNSIVLDNGIMIFNASSSKGGELSFLNNTVAAYKDMIDLRRGNLTTIAWEWK